jgi:hypothetical protein
MLVNYDSKTFIVQTTRQGTPKGDRHNMKRKRAGWAWSLVLTDDLKSITVQLTSCLNDLESADNFCFYLQNKLIQTGQTGGQLYSDTSPFSVPWSGIEKCLLV